MKLMRMGVTTLALLVAGAAGAEAQRFGVQVNWGDDVDLGVGGRVELDLPFSQTGTFSRTFLIGSFDYFFDACGAYDCTYWEINANAAIPLVASSVDPYVGAGVNYATFSSDDCPAGFDCSTSDVGLNLLGGLRFPLGSLSAYGEGRLELGGGEQLVLTFGIMVGGSR